MNSYILNHITESFSCRCKSTRSKKIVIFCCILGLIMLSGCSSASDFLLRHSGIMSEEDYQRYIELRNSGQLDSDGRYVTTELAGEQVFSPPAGSIHVTFAENAYITVQYYLDASLKTLANTQQCYLKPGDYIYASKPECHHPSSNWYSFDRFCVYPYDAEGNQGDELFWNIEEDSPLVLQIPEGYEGTEIAVIPMGKYEKRRLELSDYYTDSANQTQELDGTWIVNDKEVSSNILSVSPVESLAIDYQYDPTKYSFVASNPSSFYHENGLVRFEIINATEDIDYYTVELRALEGRFLFEPANYPVKNGTVTFKYLDRVITESEYIPDGGIIQFTAIPDSGYSRSNRTGQIVVNVSDPDGTNEKIKEAVKFHSDGNVDVRLPRPIGGTIEYTADGKVLTGESCTLPAGTKITIKFKNWNGWIKNIADGEYSVTDQKNGQSVALKGIDINTGVFEEAEKHKPTLNVVLTNSVKDNIKFDISAPNTEIPQGLSYATGNKTTFIPDWLGQNDRIVYSGKVGTYPYITLTAKDDTILAGYALKLDIKMKDTRGNEYTSIRYIEDLPAEEKIELYNTANIANSTTVYETINITISEVEVVSYRTLSVDHATITATLNDMTTPYVLKDGDVLESSRNTEIAIIPENGYYVVGSKGNNGIYSETVKYSKWEKESQKMLNKHPVEKIWYVTLSNSDSYGACVYKLDGTVVSGRVGIREGQKLTLEYTLTSFDKKIIRSGPGGFVGGLVHSKTENCTIPVSETLDGKTIHRSDYIQVK